MQRSFTCKSHLAFLFYILLLSIYESIAGIYPILPPLLAVIYLFFSRALDEKNIYKIVLFIALLLLFEVNYDYFIFSSILYFLVIKFFLLPKLEQLIVCKKCQLFIFTLFVYFGFWFLYNLIANIFIFDHVAIDFHMIYYVLIDFFLLSLYEN